MSSLSKELRRLRKLEKDYLWCIRYLNDWGIEKDRQLSLLKRKSAQQNMHLTSWSLRGLLASFWLRVSSALKHFTSPPTGR